jgi:hypothetical protein
MYLRSELEKRIEKKQQEIAGYDRAKSEAESYLQALQDMLKIFPKEGLEAKADTLRHGSELSRVKDLISKAGKPLPIDTILEGLNKEKTKENKLSLAGSLSSYVRKHKIFTRPLPNTFGLLEMGAKTEEVAPPPDFGILK